MLIQKNFGTADHGVGFVGLDDVNGEGFFRGDVDIGGFAEAGFVFRGVNEEVEIAATANDVLTNHSVTFADGGGENQRIETVHGGDHFADRTLDAINIHIISEFGTGVAVVAQFDYLAHVVSLPGDAE